MHQSGCWPLLHLQVQISRYPSLCPVSAPACLQGHGPLPSSTLLPCGLPERVSEGPATPKGDVLRACPNRDHLKPIVGRDLPHNQRCTPRQGAFTQPQCGKGAPRSLQISCSLSGLSPTPNLTPITKKQTTPHSLSLQLGKENKLISDTMGRPAWLSG